jgi:hypothetical protein
VTTDLSNSQRYTDPSSHDQDWLVEEIGRYSYKPNFRMMLLPPHDPGSTGQWMLKVRMRVPDSRVPIQRKRSPVGDWLGSYGGDDYDLRFRRDEDIDVAGPLASVQGIYAIPHYIDREEFRRWLIHQLQLLEEHELREWLRYDGELIDDPHAPGARP